ncbi:MAG: murein biosynthesis integral membrane protein MurJ [Agrococcus casei]|uniref:murein biosynthesis integral membrane protein MurJ n=1 Tax=Agrococcus casei TaxID=343512 RepID=UPI003F8DDD0B
MNIGRSSLILASGTMISRALGFVRSMLLAITLGSTGSEVASSFGIANTLPNNIYALIGAGLLNAVLVPLIVRQLRNRDGGQAYISKLLTLCVTAFFGFTIIMTLATPFLVWINASTGERGMSPEAYDLAIALGYWCMPQIFFYAISTLLGEIYNARGKFGPFTWAPVVNNLVSIVGLGIFLLMFGMGEINEDPEIWGIDRIAAMGIVTTGGVFMQALVLVLFFRKTGLTFRPDFRWRGVGLRATGTKAMWLFGIVVISQILAIVQTRVATLTDTEAGPSLLTMYNAWYVFQLPHSIIAVSIAIVYFTQMSTFAADNDIPRLRAGVANALRAVGMLTTFAMVAIIVMAIPFARLFERSFEHSLVMGGLIMVNMLALVPFSGQYVLERVYYALEDVRTPFFTRVAFMPLMLIVLLLSALLPGEYVILGITAGQALYYICWGAAWVFLVRRKIGPFGIRHVAQRHLVYLGLSLVAGAVGAVIIHLFGGYNGGWAHNGVLSSFVTCAVAGIVMAAVYFAALYLIRDRDFRLVADRVIGKLRGRGGAAE